MLIQASCMTFLVVLVWLISLRQQTFNWTGLLWRIKQIKEGVIHRGQRPRWITPSEKHARNTLLKHAYLLAASMLSIFDSVRSDLSSSVNILQIADVALRVVFLLFLLFFAIILPSSSCTSYSWNEWSVRHFSFYIENNSISSIGLLG